MRSGEGKPTWSHLMISWLLRFSCRSLLSSPWSSCTVMYSSSTKEPRASASASLRGPAAADEEDRAVWSPGQSWDEPRASRLEEAEADAEVEAPGLLLLLAA